MQADKKFASWVARNWDSVSKWTEDTALAVLLQALSSPLWFDSWGQKPKVK